MTSAFETAARSAVFGLGPVFGLGRAGGATSAPTNAGNARRAIAIAAIFVQASDLQSCAIDDRAIMRVLPCLKAIW